MTTKFTALAGLLLATLSACGIPQAYEVDSGATPAEIALLESAVDAWCDTGEYCPVLSYDPIPGPRHGRVMFIDGTSQCARPDVYGEDCERAGRFDHGRGLIRIWRGAYANSTSVGVWRNLVHELGHAGRGHDDHPCPSPSVLAPVAPDPHAGPALEIDDCAIENFSK